MVFLNQSRHRTVTPDFWGEAFSVWRTRNEELPFDSQKLPELCSKKEKHQMLPLFSSCFFSEGILKLGSQGHATFLEKASKFSRCKIMGQGVCES